MKDNSQDLWTRCRSVSGKSGAFFYFTKNKQFIIKSIKPDEFKVLASMIKEYCDLVTVSDRSLLAKIFGVFKVTIDNSTPRMLVILENLSRHFHSPLIFDLKGSTHMRQSSQIDYKSFDFMPKTQVYKDKDFLNCYQNRLSHKEGKSVFELLEQDTFLLEKHEIMDYSLLFLIEEIKNPRGSIINSCNTFRMGNYICCVGIIDYLQNYSYKKKLETQINKFKKDQTSNFSCIPPDAYRTRFLKLMFDIFMTSSSPSS